jgi:ketopantoate reductase
LKSYDIDEILISKLIDSKKEVLFLQNGLLVQSKIKDTTQLFAIGTVTGIQSKLKGKRIDVKIQNTSIIAKLNDKTYKLNELAVGQNLPHTKLNFGSDVQTEFYKKYVRWILTGCLNLLNNKGIGDSLKQTPKGDILLAITELIIFIEYEFNLKIYADDILNTMYSLPKNLKTSSYSDFQKGKPTEILNELDYVVSILKTFNNQSLMLEKWKGDIIHEK